MTDLSELLERVKAATGPDRVLDRALFDAFCGGIFDEAKVGRFFRRIRWDAEPIEFTDSVDAAISLAERMLSGDDDAPLLYSFDLNWNASAHPHMAYAVTLHVAVGDPPDMQTFHGQAETMPLALLRALLSALQSQAGK